MSTSDQNLLQRIAQHGENLGDDPGDDPGDDLPERFSDNFSMHVTGAVDAPKLVFLHGVMGFAANFRKIAKAFENDYQVLTYDQRGHGRSFQSATGYGPEDYGEDLLKILDDLGWSKIRLVGHSMGGRAAYAFAAKYPTRVDQLVIEDIGPSTPKGGSNFVLRLLDTVPVPFASKKAAKDWFDHEFIQVFNGERKIESLAGYLYANITENKEGQAVWRFFEPGIRESTELGKAHDGWKAIEALKMPTLLVRGEFSQDLSRQTYEQMLKVNSLITGIEIKSAGHWVHSDHPELFISTLREFFDKKAGAR